MGSFAIAVVLGGALVLLSAYLWWRNAANANEARRLVREGALLVDVDPPERYETSHLEGAINIPAHEIAARASELGPLERPIVLYARTEGPSARAARVLRGLGYHTVVRVGTMKRWSESKVPTRGMASARVFERALQRLPSRRTRYSR